MVEKEPCCNATVRKGIMTNNPNITAVYFEQSNIQNVASKDRVWKTGQTIEVHYNHTLKNGEIREKHRKSFVAHQYCPFCGKKYEK